MKSVLNILVGLIVCLGSTVAWAAGDWLISKDDTGFGTKHIAMGVGNNSVLLVACEDSALAVTIATPEEYDIKAAVGINLVSAHAIISIDGADVQRYDIKIEENGLGKMIAVMAIEDQSVLRSLIEQFRSAKKSVAFGLEVEGKKYHASKIAAAGKRLQSILSACPPAASTN